MHSWQQMAMNFKLVFCCNIVNVKPKADFEEGADNEANCPRSHPAVKCLLMV